MYLIREDDNMSDRHWCVSYSSNALALAIDQPLSLPAYSDLQLPIRPPQGHSGLSLAYLPAPWRTARCLAQGRGRTPSPRMRVNKIWGGKVAPAEVVL